MVPWRYSLYGQPVGAAPTDRIVGRLEKNYVGQFDSKEDFLAKLRKDYDWGWTRQHFSRAAQYHVSIGEHYFKRTVVIGRNVFVTDMDVG